MPFSILMDYLPSFDEGNLLATQVSGSVLLLALILNFWPSLKSTINLPTVGPAGRLTSFIGAVKFCFQARSMLEEGYQKFNGATFKVPRMGSWHVVVNKPELIEEVAKAREDVLSASVAFDEFLQVKHTMGPFVYANRFHEDVIRTKLTTSSISAIFDEMKDEIVQAFVDNIRLDGSDWTPLATFHLATNVICRASNRVFVGLPLCRDTEYINLMTRSARDVVEGASIINLFPELLRGIAGHLFTTIPQNTRKGVKLLGPIIEARWNQYEAHGKDWAEKPNDLLSWLMDEAAGEQRSVLALTQRLLTVNFVSIHTSSVTFTQALHELASRQEYIQPIREEIESVIESDGWTKLAMQKMSKLDSFMKESQRYNGILLTTVQKKALVDYQLSDGTFLPKGTFIAANTAAIHRNNPDLLNPDKFDGFRFSRLNDETSDESRKNQYVTTSNDYLSFGHGRHACPGRFFAANELKCMMAYLLLNYDIKLEDGMDSKPKDVEFGTFITSDTKARIMLRKRQA